MEVWTKPLGNGRTAAFIINTADVPKAPKASTIPSPALLLLNIMLYYICFASAQHALELNKYNITLCIIPGWLLFYYILCYIYLHDWCRAVRLSIAPLRYGCAGRRWYPQATQTQLAAGLGDGHPAMTLSKCDASRPSQASVCWICFPPCTLMQ